MTACVFRLGVARSGSPGSETGSSQPEPPAVTAGEGPSSSRSEKPWSRVSRPPYGATTHQTAAEGKACASARSPNRSSGCHRGGAAETHRGDAD